MRKIITISLTLLSLVSCSKSYNIDVISVKYIEYLNNNIESNDEYNVLVTEIETEDKTVYRMTASNNKLEKDDLPYRYFKYKKHYVLIFNLNKNTSEVIERNLEKVGLFKEDKTYFPLDNYPEWIFILCNNEKYLLFKDSWYRPLDEIEEINNFKCN